MGMIFALYSHHYHIRRLRVKPADQGHRAVSRKRLYLILTRKGKVREVADPQQMYDKVSQYIQSFVATKVEDKVPKKSGLVQIKTSFLYLLAWVGSQQ